MKISNLHRTLGTLLIFILLLPITMQAVHAFNKHEHIVCSAKNVQHFHNSDLDCSAFHFQIKHNAIDFSSDFQLIDCTIKKESNEKCAHQSYFIYLYSKSSRAPPTTILD